jgi:hypothetical protein
MHVVGLPYGSHPERCPVRALAAWLEQSNITSLRDCMRLLSGVSDEREDP